MYRDPLRTGWGRRRRGPKLLEFVRPETGARIVPQLTLEPKEGEEVSFVGKYLELADRALHNRNLGNPASNYSKRRRKTA